MKKTYFIRYFIFINLYESKYCTDTEILEKEFLDMMDNSSPSKFSGKRQEMITRESRSMFFLPHGYYKGSKKG